MSIQPVCGGDASLQAPKEVQAIAAKSTALAITFPGNPPNFEPAVCVDSRGFFISGYATGPFGIREVPLLLYPGQPNQRTVRAEVVVAGRLGETCLLKVDDKGPFTAPEIVDIPKGARFWQAIFVRADERSNPPPPYPAVLVYPGGKFAEIPGDVKYGAQFDESGRLQLNAIARALLQTPQLVFAPHPIAVTDLGQDHDLSIGVQTALGKPLEATVELALGLAGEWKSIARDDGHSTYRVRMNPSRIFGDRKDRVRRLEPIPFRLAAQLPGGKNIQTQGNIEVFDPAELASIGKFREAALQEAQTKVLLPGECNDLVPAAGGRMLLAHFRKLKRLGVFDLSECRMVKYLDIADLEDPLIAGAARKAIALDRKTGRIIRWDLESMERDREVQFPFPKEHSPRRLQLGYASDGPLAVLVGSDPSPGLYLFNLATLEATGPLHNLSLAARDLESWCAMNRDQTLRFLGVQSGLLWRPALAPPLRIATAVPEDRYVFRSHEIVDMKAVPPRIDPIGQHCASTSHPGFFMTFRYRDDAGPVIRKGTILKGISLYTLGGKKPIADLELTDITTHSLNTLDIEANPGIAMERRVYCIPQSNAVVSLPDGRDHIVLHRVDIPGSLANSTPDFLLVDTHPPMTAYRGQTLVYEPKARSRSGKVTFRVEVAPHKMTQVRPGRIEWPVPRELTDQKVNVSILFHDSLGAETYQTFTIAVR